MDRASIKNRPGTRGLSPSLAGALLLAGAVPAWGRDYFDPGLLALGGNQLATTDLTVFESSGQTPEGRYLVTLWVNQSEQGQHSLVFKKDAQGQVLPQLTPAFLHGLGVNTEALPSFSGLPPEAPIANLEKLIPESQLRFDLAQLRLDISIPQVAMQQHARDFVDPEQWDEGVPALLMNYSLNGSRNWQSAQHGMGKSEQSNMFANLLGGVNYQGWRLRSTMTYTYSESRGGSSSSRYQRSQFSDTYLQHDIRAWRAEILAGESSSGNDVFDSIPFRGIKLNSSEDMLPNSLRGFAPVIAGIAQSNARVTVSQNGNIVYQTYVAPGPFRINDLYQSSQGGDLTVTITEADGSVRSQTLAFSSLPVMQRPGALKYELTSGRYNGGITKGSREATFGLGTFMYGLPYNVTLYGGALVATDYHSLVAGSGLSLGDFGAISADVTSSDARLEGQNERQQGASYRLRYAKSLLSTGTSVDLAAYRYSTRNYYTFSDFNNLGFELNAGQTPWALTRQRSNFQLRISQQLDSWGAIYLSASRNDYWGNSQVNNTVSVGYNGSYRGVSYGMAYSIDRIKGDGSWPENRQLSMTVQIPVSLFSSAVANNQSYASYQVTHNNQGQVQQQAGIGGNAMDDRLSYNLMQGWSNDNGNDNSTLNMGYRGSKGQANVGYSYSNQLRSLNLSGNGSLLLHPEGLTLGPMLGNSVAVVSAPGAGGVEVLNGNIRTDSRGYALVPYLANYQNNSISLNPTTLPEDVDMAQSSLNVYPTKGAVIMAKFDTRVGYQALVTLLQGDTSLPFGTVITVADTPAGKNNTGIVGDAGQVYLSGLPEQGTLTAKWGHADHQQCRASFNLSGIAAPSASNPIRQLTARCETGQ
ncbi:fimbria/pilus outer membrane usher protein [Serratia fonticola]|uniref:fimbria/pilus outer membrane usher protein n=1 Tax=Serratia fonticola TaxID=47917 RepID=UPI00217C22F5|nr:fimbria/pilus outer membrane usher protein [Serratia fonticola]CAI1543543.1 Outer membrane usher protein fimD precursor [Serratia fonticola]